MSALHLTFLERHESHDGPRRWRRLVDVLFVGLVAAIGCSCVVAFCMCGDDIGEAELTLLPEVKEWESLFSQCKLAMVEDNNPNPLLSKFDKLCSVNDDSGVLEPVLEFE